MNIYEKLALAKVALHEKGLKKSGKNEFAKYDYFELSDFMPEIVKQECLLKFCCIVNFADVATLEIVNSEKPDDKIVFQSPMSSASLKGMHEVQNMGAVQTYIRRYLYTNAFEIAESDAIDGARQDKQVITTAQLNVLKRGVIGLDGKPDQAKREKLKAIYTKYGYTDSKDIQVKDYDKIKVEFEGENHE